jgi:hypothetical protein
MSDDILESLVDRADLDALVRLVDEWTTSGDWDGLEQLRRRCREAVRTGRQLWPAATLATVRLALLGPPQHVAAVLDDASPAQFSPGPLTEIAAVRHGWHELRDVLEPGPAATVVAHERVVRGEDLTGDPVLAGLPEVLPIPARLLDWEPDYALAEYAVAGHRFPSPPPIVVDGTLIALEADPTSRFDGDRLVIEAFRDLVSGWTAGSDGRAEVVAAIGDERRALAALGIRSARWCPIDTKTAVSWLAWAGASGGAHGRRRGAAAGRAGAWWLLEELTGATTHDALGALAEGIEWSWWDAGEPETGWRLQLTARRSGDGVTWAFSARDAA